MNSPSYIIPMDELDLSLLPYTYFLRRNVTPSWNLQRDNDLCEFRICSETVNNESGKYDPAQNQEIKTAMCHICKVEVPVQYLKEHRASLKHRTYLKIANIAMQRLRDEVNNNIEVEEKNSIKYFCCHCTEVVSVNDKKKHDDSTNHQNALFMDNYITNFMELYANTSDTVKDLKPSEPERSESTSNDSEKLLSAIQTPKIGEDEFDLDGYLNVLKNKHHMATNVKVVGAERLQIEIEGSKIHISADNFHGMKNGDAGFIECIVCKKMVSNENKWQHLMEAKHTYRVSVPLRDIHCRREIYPLWHHCILCNTIIENYKEHTVSDQTHNAHLEAALRAYYESTENTSSTSKDIKLGQNINKDYLNNNAYGILKEMSVDSSIKSNDADKKFFCTDCNIEIRKASKRAHLHSLRHKWNTESPYHYLYTVNTITCRICATDATDLKVHVMSQDHIQKYKMFLSENRLVKIDDNSFFCMFCFEIVLLKNELLHTYIPVHKTQATRDRTNENYYCTVCNTTVPNTEYNVQTHNEGKPHIKNMAIIIKDPSLKADIWEPTSSPIHLKCLVCNIFVPNTKSNLKYHLQTDKHINKNAKVLQNNVMEIKEDCIYCKVCNVSVDNKVYVIHMKGKQHLKRLNNYNESITSDIQNSVTINQTNVNDPEVNENKITTVPDIVMNHMEINETSKTDEESNETGENMNRSDLTETTNESVVTVKRKELCDNEDHIGINEATSNTNGEICSETGDEINDSTVVEIDMNEYSECLKPSPCSRHAFCSICEVNLPFRIHNIKEHLNGNKHKQKVEENS